MAVEKLTAIGVGLTAFAVIIALGMVVLQKFGDTVALCPNSTLTDATFNVTTHLCYNGTATATPLNTAFSTVSSISTYMGTSGLAGWIPVIIVVLVAGLIMALFGGKGKEGDY
jgi:hypothetical protein